MATPLPPGRPRLIVGQDPASPRSPARGQALVEFALVFPVLLLVIVGIIEFAFAFSTLNSLNFAARDVALSAAEAGNQAGSDCSALALLEKELGASTNPGGIKTVRIYWSDNNGNVLNGAVNRYDRIGSMTCSDVNGVSHTLPYTAAPGTYAEASRCSVLLGCPSPPAAVNHPTVDTVGVQLTYTYAWRTALGALLGFTGTPTFQATQQVRMEPIL